ncbi:aspartate aminotransferase family protein [Phaeovibrio sulfidiphilus]|uniref:Acetylornithine aminotransferase n=1 Tax=Phaeovibrio sulfidiphilus TaxID=1220600 RepID=A0A8J7CQ68_9PROT|nr:aspartate aminotransferase family protein [Phaeovibrio sulfidiphilus]MBE1236525.1 aspartate aminotransferase family protein [Phaeovibrio sulfidiphilus]
MSTDQALMPSYSRLDLSFERGEGAWLFASDGRRFLDFATGIAVVGLGHSHPRIVQALKDQAEKLWHCSNLYRIPGQERLAEQLCAASFADCVIFVNSGAEANEAALKLARRYQYLKHGGPKRWRVIAAKNAFHGRTMATLAAGGQERHLEGFQPATEGFDHVPYGDLEAARAAVTPETGAIIVEPIQGEGGLTPAPEGYLKGLRELADREGLLLIFDEVQTGMGRTGRLFAHEHDGVTPHILSTAKGIGNGFPLGACLATREVGAAFTPGSHGSTYGGNPLAMAVGSAVIEELTSDGFLENVRHSSEILREGVERLIADRPNGAIEGVRGRGLMLGLVCRTPNTDVLTALRNAGLLTVQAGGNVVRLLPPLTIGRLEIDAALEMIGTALDSLEGETP